MLGPIKLKSSKARAQSGSTLKSKLKTVSSLKKTQKIKNLDIQIWELKYTNLNQLYSKAILQTTFLLVSYSCFAEFSNQNHRQYLCHVWMSSSSVTTPTLHSLASLNCNDPWFFSETFKLTSNFTSYRVKWKIIT